MNSPASIIGLVRQSLQNLVELIKAEIELGKAEARAAVLWLIGGLASIVGTVLFAFLFMVFLLGTVAEGVQAADNWLFAAAIAAVILASFWLWLGDNRIFRWLAGLFMLAALGFLVAFIVVAIIAVAPEQARRGWAIITAAMIGLTVTSGGLAAFLLIGAVKRAKRTFIDVREDIRFMREVAPWFKTKTPENE